MMASRDSGRAVAGGLARHIPVLGRSTVEFLAVRTGGVYVDATFGAGGHTRDILAAANCNVIGIDRDQSAIARGADLVREAGGRLVLVEDKFSNLEAVARSCGYDAIDGVVFDLGVSSMQLDVTDRGFAYREDAPLDMRMDPTTGPTAADVLNTYSRGELARILKEYGEERFAGRIAGAIVREREHAPFTTSARLVELLYDQIPAPARRTGGHPAKRTFQALRIEVNGELDALERALPAALDALALGGRIVVLAYHSLEDRVVKRTLAARAVDTTPRGLPVTLAAAGPQLRLLTRGAERPSAAEVAANPRAASARLRAAMRIRDAA
jgi:16S rRNA (cytosine1402-N4)-methyltransferase